MPQLCAKCWKVHQGACLPPGYKAGSEWLLDRFLETLASAEDAPRDNRKKAKEGTT